MVGRYVLDIVRMFEKYNYVAQKYEPENSILAGWEKEYVLRKNSHFIFINNFNILIIII